LEVVRQRVPGHWTGDGERLTAEHAATMSWYDEMVAAGRSKSLTTGNLQFGVAAVHEVLGSPALETPVNCQSSELISCRDECWKSSISLLQVVDTAHHINAEELSDEMCGIKAAQVQHRVCCDETF